MEVELNSTKGVKMLEEIKKKWIFQENNLIFEII